MARGRKRTPDAAKVIAGRIPGKVRGAAAANLVMPAWMDAAAKTKWKPVLPELDRLGLVATTDADCLAAYCQSWAEFVLATKTLQKEGRYAARGTGGLALHPAAQQQRIALTNLRAYGALLGLSPADRGRLRVPPANAERDELEEFLADHA